MECEMYLNDVINTNNQQIEILSYKDVWCVIMQQWLMRKSVANRALIGVSAFDWQDNFKSKQHFKTLPRRFPH
jgi:hypothetical protein